MNDDGVDATQDYLPIYTENAKKVVGKVKLKGFFIVLFPIFSLSCSAQIPQEDSGLQEDITPYLADAMKNTPYSALVKNTAVSFVKKISNEDWEYLISANVLETYRGQQVAEVKYSIIVPKNESISVGGPPVILTLCEFDKKFYWPGVGAQFPASKKLISSAKKIKLQLQPNQTKFSGC